MVDPRYPLPSLLCFSHLISRLFGDMYHVIVSHHLVQPEPYNTRDYLVTGTNITEYFNGSIPISWTVKDNKVVYQELIFYAKFENRQPSAQNPNETAQFFGFFKDDIQFQVKLTGEKPDNILFEGPIRSYLRCKQNRDCDRTYLLRIAPVFQKEYTISVQLLNGNFLLETGLVTPNVGLSVTNVDQAYTTTSLVLRCIFLAASTVFAVAYILVLIWRQYFRLWASEQRFTVVLLVLTVLYNNPIFWLEYMNGSWVFPFLSALFIATYICFLLLSLLVFTHSVITVQSQRHLIWFYFPKWFICGILWIFLVVVLTLYSVFTSQSASSINTQSAEFIIVTIILTFLLLIYFLVLLYYFIRVVSKIRILPGKNRKKFVFTWLFTGVIIVVTIVDLILYAYGSRIGGSAYNAFFFAYNLYTFFISIMFWPARNESTEKEEERERAILAMSEESEFRGF